MNVFKLTVYSIIVLISILAFADISSAGQVTIASYDFDEDHVDEIIRTDEDSGSTYIRIYKKIDQSYFYRPFQIFSIPGRLVQVPEIIDVNDDGLKDYFFATGTDMGVLYYDFVGEQFKRSNALDFDLSSGTSPEKKRTAGPAPQSSDESRKSLKQMSAEYTSAEESDYELQQLKSVFNEPSDGDKINKKSLPEEGGEQQHYTDKNQGSFSFSGGKGAGTI